MRFSYSIIISEHNSCCMLQPSEPASGIRGSLMLLARRWHESSLNVLLHPKPSNKDLERKGRRCSKHERVSPCLKNCKRIASCTNIYEDSLQTSWSVALRNLHEPALWHRAAIQLSSLAWSLVEQIKSDRAGFCGALSCYIRVFEEEV